MITSTQLRPGMIIKFNNDLYSIFSMSHRTPGNLRGFVQVKMRNLRNGSMGEHRFSSEDKVERAIMEDHEFEYLYDDGEYYYFMNIENYEQMHLTKDILGDAVYYLTPNLKISIEFYEGKAMGVELPATVDHHGQRNRTGIERLNSLQRNQARHAGNRLGRSGAGRSLPKGRRSGSILRKAPIKSELKLGFFPGKHSPQIQQCPAAFDPRDDWRIVRAQFAFDFRQRY